MPNATHRGGLFPALLKHWRGQRGLSQLDLALAADVSSRHISFLETGRSAPSTEMILRLAATLDVPLRQVNAMLQSAGFEPVYSEPPPEEALPDEIASAIQLMKEHHEPFPLMVVDRNYDVIDLNTGSLALFASVMGGPLILEGKLNLVRLTFDPNGAQQALLNFDEVGSALLWRMQREVLANPEDTQLRELLEEILAMPTVKDDWRKVDLSVPSSPAIVVHLRGKEHEFRFITTITAFQAPQTVRIDELRIETWFPCDKATAEACRQLAKDMLF